MIKPDDVLGFWLDEITPDDWYLGGEDLDQTITEKFKAAWEEAAAGSYGLWLTYPNGMLAYIVLTDQLPRSMFRGSDKSFKLDKYARAAAKVSIARGWDRRIDAPARQFFYMPLMHSENLCDQERCVRLMKERMPDNGATNLLHAKAHREIIRRFGRFPYRNEALHRVTNPNEAKFIENGGYKRIISELKEVLAA